MREAAAERAGAAGARKIFEEMGDLLFAAANLARKLGVDAESGAARREREIRAAFPRHGSLGAQARGEDFANLDLAAQESLWQEVEACRMRRAMRANARARRPLVVQARSRPADHREAASEIIEALRAHQVLIVAGDTGSGKSTQLPQYCLELGRGREGLIAHTQPRRLAARALGGAHRRGTVAAGRRDAWDSACVSPTRYRTPRAWC